MRIWLPRTVHQGKTDNQQMTHLQRTKDGTLKSVLPPPPTLEWFHTERVPKLKIFVLLDFSIGLHAHKAIGRG